MNRKRVIIVVVSVFLVLSATTVYLSFRQKNADLSESYVPGSIIVTFKPDYKISATAIEAVAKSVSGTVGYNPNLDNMHIYEITVRVGREEAAVAELKSKPEVESVYRNIYGRGETH